MYSRTPLTFHWVTFVILMVILAAIWIPGLSGSATSLGHGRVTGRVTYNGKPVTKGAIILMPSDRRGPDWASAQLDKDGYFALADQAGKTELAPGQYTIFMVFREDAPAEARPLRSRFDLEDTEKPITPPKPEPPPIPARYTNPETSGLWINLGKEANRIFIDLKD